MKQMTIEDIHHSLLGIAEEMHKVCVKHDIPYYMLGGTMLGAIRHKGFIPWDDDMDFGVPRSYYIQLRSFLEKELPKRYHVVCEDWVDPIAFFKIEDTETLVYQTSSKRKDLSVGLNIDVFPLDNCTLDSHILKPIYKQQRWLNAIHNACFTNMRGFSLPKRFVMYVIKIFYPISKEKWLLKFKRLESRLSATGEDGMVNFSGIYKMKEVLDKKIFGSPRLYVFDDTELYGPEDADAFLRQLYGNYMILPPENQRRFHSLSAYYK